MSKYARIEEGVVKETGEFDFIEGRFHPDLIWAECSADTRQGDLWNGTVFSKVPRDVAAEKAAFILAIDTDTDSLIRSVIGERGGEYELAEDHATAYKAAGYPATPVPSSVSAWATAKGWSNTQATDSIVAAATGWRSAQEALRAARLLCKEQGRVAVDATELDALKAQWSGFMAALKTQLGV